MSNLIKLVLALFLGVVAAGANWLWVSAQAKPPTYVAAKSTLKLGHTIKEDDLIDVPVPGDADKLKKALIPFRNRAILFGADTTREYEAGDIFFQRDITPPDEQSQWDVIGPFRLFSVGARFKQPADAAQIYESSSGNNVTIEVSSDFDEKTTRLLEMISPAALGKKSDEKKRIVAVQVVPAPQNTTMGRTRGINTVYQTVSLEGIANVPEVLLEGDMIRFVIPGAKSY